MYTKQKHKKRIFSMGIVLLLCIFVLGFSGCGAGDTPKETEPPTQNATNGQQSQGNDTLNSQRSGEQDLEPFSSIEVHVQSPDIRIEKGKGYSVRYHLHSREKIADLKVENGVLHFDTVLDSQWVPDDDKKELVITVPSNVKLKKAELHTAAGEVLLEDFSVSEVSLSSAAGRVEAKNVHSDKMLLHSTAKQVIATNCTVQSMQADTASGDMTLQGTFHELHAKTISSTCKVSGQVTEDAEIETVSGRIFFSAPVGSVDAESIGGITLDNVSKGNTLEMQSGKPTIKLKSVSGAITIETKQTANL